ncbi:Methyltransferase type 12 [Nitrobacter hamburgensis X14]|uniref:Methyltransferase type 12 n=1 Tax=Nitrobacter hamburgensis (strain DSM 10229 / NCIMB 13809 / X14) TaxID=323097 RepID=Q1QII1_NITHX|nr:small ribosomal subunit Rsm22 family protein [Nitrobacter hamburgensis]ABE63966.1 Methyltransferase type 12 [Nitrobacter hamburgensis X14]
MIPPALPAALRAALDRKAHGLSRSDAAARAAAISQTYRGGGGSGAIRGESDALAYALARMPATYAAVVASLNALREIRPEFAPGSLLDVGAGPGTATWAAAQAFDSLDEFTALDANPALRILALDLAADHARLHGLRYAQSEASAGLRDAAASADLVVASYVIGEMNADRQDALADLMWAATRDTLLVVEPGTPAGYQRILDLRRRLVAQGAHVVAPCPHNEECPLITFSAKHVLGRDPRMGTASREENASKQKAAPDWCHFVQRLPRSRAHKHIKGAELPFEDEKFSYVALARTPARQHPARVLAPPLVTKAEMRVKLCRPDGHASLATFRRRDKAAYARVRRLGWGDTVNLIET